MPHSRRQFLSRGLALGCSAAASPLLTPVTFAAAPGNARLVVIVLRGAMDGLDVVRPVFDGALKTHRPDMDMREGLPLSDGFRLHPALDALAPLWRAGELSFAHAVSTPYRDKRSHFDGQDMLETGGMTVHGQRDGWLNRALALVPGVETETAFAIGRERMMLLSGSAPSAAWSPDGDLALSPQARLLLDLIYAGDPLFSDAADEALALSDMTDPMAMGGGRGGATASLAQFAAERLRAETRIAAFSINGWDTHARQSDALPRALGDLSTAILTLRDGLGPVWGKTTVLCLTEFGRTVTGNGTGGTDHGTGGAAIFAGGALRGGAVLGKWPGLSENALYQRRDLMPTDDVRRYAAWALFAALPVSRSDLMAQVFPGLEMGGDVGLTA
ncbi:MAG: DUF1501 domain-containing protein [Pseudomonadota bacterium]